MHRLLRAFSFFEIESLGPPSLQANDEISSEIIEKSIREDVRAHLVEAAGKNGLQAPPSRTDEISKAQGPVAMLQERPTHDGGIGGRSLLQLRMLTAITAQIGMPRLHRRFARFSQLEAGRAAANVIVRLAAVQRSPRSVFQPAFIRFSTLSSVHSAEGRHPSNRLLGGKLHVRNILDICLPMIDQIFCDL
jgi:hypothetical protein